MLWHGTAAFRTQSSVFSVFSKRRNSYDVAMVVRMVVFFKFRRMGDKEKLAKYARLALHIMKLPRRHKQ